MVMALVITVRSPRRVKEMGNKKIQLHRISAKPLTRHANNQQSSTRNLPKIADIQSVVFIGPSEAIRLQNVPLERGQVNANNVQTEDINGNGSLDARTNEDFNGNGSLDLNNGVSGRGITVAVKDNDVRPHPDLSFSLTETMDHY